MPRHNAILLAALLAVTTALGAMPAFAQQGAGNSDCNQARDPQRCAARQQAQTNCQEKRGRAKQQCLLNQLPPPDCSKAEDSQRCEARQQARAECQGKTGKDLRSCLNEHRLH